jgi:serine phosphatase RsbU (regulator of sigma subunit)
MRNGKSSTLASGNGLACDTVSSIYEDREGSLWVGTLDCGLHQLRDSKFTTYTRKKGLSHDFINCIYEDRAGWLWIGTQEGLNRLNLKNGELTTELTTSQGLLNDIITCILEDPAGFLWVGTSGGLHKFKDGKLTTLTKKHGLSDNSIRCISEDKQGNTWIGTENGLNRYNINNKKFTFFTKKEGLLSDHIEVIYEDSKDCLWIGTDVGLNRFIDGEVSIYNPKGMFEKNWIRCIYEDNNGVLWFGTFGGLICVQDNETFRYTIRSGLIENRVYSILEDESGYLWLGGRNGISRIKKKDLEDFSQGKIRQIQPESYNEKDGMKSRWCTGIGCKTRDGRFWFPTIVGMTMIDPNHIKTNQIPPPVKIEKIIVDGQAIYIHEKEPGKTPMKLGVGKKRLEIYYKSVSFINPQKIRFKIRLQGYDDDWLDMGNSRTTTYTGLPPGDYTFNVKACNPDGVWNQEGASLFFYLQPYFYETTWFLLLAVLSVLFLGFLVYRFRVRQLKAREKELTQLVELRTRDLKERTVELENAHHKLRQSKEIIEEKNRHIMDSFRYAHKIQQTMLPIKEKLEKELKDHFVIYKPKDIVSGDFYWFDVVKDQYFLAVADCTGHGVPGALLSMIGGMMLNEVIHARHILDPAKILARLHQGFRYTLKQEIEETDTYDGMDIGLCQVDLHTGKITYAGAHHSLYYVKGSNFTEIKGDRKSIGGRQKEKKHTFTNHEIDILDKNQDGIMIYLTSDGFAAQHNPGNRKYGSRQLKQFLQSIAAMPVGQQEEALLKELIKHQANEEQRDDITIIGIRLR